MEGADLSREQVLKRDIPWETYMTAKLITGTGLQLLRRYDHRSKEVQASLLEEDGPAYMKTFLSVLRNVSKEETVEYMLALIDELLTANPRRARFFHDPSLAGDDVYGTFLRLLSRPRWFIQETTCKILTLIVSTRKKGTPIPLREMNGAPSSTSQTDYEAMVSSFVQWLCSQLKQPSHPARGAPLAISALAALLRDTPARAALVQADGVRLLAPLISPAQSQAYMQLLYETVLCVWLLTFHEPAVDAIGDTRIISRLVDVAKSSTKEKVVRVAVLALCALHKKSTYGDLMVELGLPKVVQSLKMQAWGDEDLKDALDTLESDLKAKMKTLSSFDRYKAEVMSGTLDWTPTHKDPAFWRENIGKFEDNDFQVLRVLVTLLDNSRDAKTLSVACYDLGMFIATHPSGRQVALDLKAKDRVMGLMENSDPEVRKQALLCAQKLLLSAKYVSYIQ